MRLLPRYRSLVTAHAMASLHSSVALSPLITRLPALSAKTRVVWFRNNLRLDDNPTLVAACEAARAQGENLLPLFCLDAKTMTGLTPWGHRKWSARRAAFLLESLHDLRASLREVGSDLCVTPLGPEDAIRQLAAAGGITAVHVASEVTSEEHKAERAVERILQGGSAQLLRHWDSTLHHLDDLPPGADPEAMPLTFTPWKNKVEKGSTVRAPLAAPAKLPVLPPDWSQSDSSSDSEATIDQQLGALGYPTAEVAAAIQHPRAALQFKGGETAARERLQVPRCFTHAVAERNLYTAGHTPGSIPLYAPLFWGGLLLRPTFLIPCLAPFHLATSPPQTSIHTPTD